MQDQNKYTLRLIFFHFSTQQVNNICQFSHSGLTSNFEELIIETSLNPLEREHVGPGYTVVNTLLKPLWDVSWGEKKPVDEAHCASLSLVVWTHITVLWHSSSAFAPSFILGLQLKYYPCVQTDCSMLSFIPLKQHSDIVHVSNVNEITEAFHTQWAGQYFILFLISRTLYRSSSNT